MIHIGASEFKAKCLALIDEVGETGDVIVIEKRGRPVAQLQRYVPAVDDIPQKSLRGSVSIKADLTEPAVPAASWESEKR